MCGNMGTHGCGKHTAIVCMKSYLCQGAGCMGILVTTGTLNIQPLPGLVPIQYTVLHTKKGKKPISHDLSKYPVT
ncbi:hypothetical protein DSO57_1034989 [Entomophthora muscae]|uniref:Uncharacterized protein n=1 Tax=Entomophthora muscae TaxID=34485 RepID=A0ACC2REE7_9FUNG|nr:hypothetical protein DSO57_1034989 [Entomophthora muscae]